MAFQDKHADFRPSKTAHVDISFFTGNRAGHRDNLDIETIWAQRPDLDVDAGGLRVGVVPREFRGLRVQSAEVNKTVVG